MEPLVSTNLIVEQLNTSSSSFSRLYNCSVYDVGSVPLEQRQHVILGTAFVLISVIEEILYAPCLVAICRLSKENANASCFKVMFVMGVLDMLALPICGMATGVMGITGAVFCSWPGPIYLMGAIRLGLWVSETTVDVVLAVNRCMALLVPDHTLERLFGGWRVWAWMMLAIAYGLYVTIFQRAAVFNGILFAWLFNPHTGYMAAEDYASPLLTVHSLAVAFALIFIYALLIATLIWQIFCIQGERHVAAGFAQHKMIFIQVALISSVNGIGACIYTYIQYFPTAPPWLDAMATIFWTQAHGLPPLIYLLMNRTIRKECYGLFFTEKKRPSETPIGNNQHQRHQQQMLNITRSHSHSHHNSGTRRGTVSPLQRDAQ